MTGLDRFEGRPGARDGYWPSAWPAECGGNRRQKAAIGHLDAAAGTGSVASRRNGRWNVMFVEREPDQWYLGGTMPAFSGPEPFGWVERLDLGAGGCGLEIDASWRPRYRAAGGRYGLAWDSCISGGDCWIVDCGDIESVRAIHTAVPNGRFEEPPGSRLSWRRPAPWPGAQRLLRFSLADDGDRDEIEPFGTPGGGIIAPLVHVPEVSPGVGMAIAWDSINGGLAGVEVPAGTTSVEMSVAWHLDVRPSMQPVVYPDSGELVINDFRPGSDGGPPADDLVAVDIATGRLIDRVSTGSRVANGMFLSAAADRRVLYASTTTLALVSWS